MFLSCAVLCLITQSYRTLCNHIDYCSLPGSPVQWVLQEKNTGMGYHAILPSSKGSSQSRHQTQVSHIERRLFTIWATRETHSYHRFIIFFLRYKLKAKSFLNHAISSIGLSFLKMLLKFYTYFYPSHMCFQAQKYPIHNFEWMISLNSAEAVSMASCLRYCLKHVVKFPVLETEEQQLTVFQKE